MKNSGNLFAMMLMSVLFFSCDKDKHEVQASNNLGAPMEYNTARGSTITAAETSAVGEVKFDAGQIFVHEVRFEGRLAAPADGGSASAGQPVAGWARLHSMVDMYNPRLSSEIVVPRGTYDQGAFTFIIASMDRNPSLLLSGSFTDTRGMVIPVKVTMQETMPLYIKSTPEPFTISSNIVYVPQLTASLSHFSRVINADVLQKATITDGAIYISRESNAEIYHMFLRNLQNGAIVRF